MHWIGMQKVCEQGLAQGYSSTKVLLAGEQDSALAGGGLLEGTKAFERFESSDIIN